MPQMIYSPAADTDLWQILLYIAEDNENAAFRLIETIDGKCRLLSEFPGLGMARPELSPDLRSFPAGNYLILYRPISIGIEVVRVVHGARDLRKLFGA
jgi:toxin ParE1/3/4